MTTTRCITTTTAVLLSLAAAGAPAASARPTDSVPTGRQAPASVYSHPDKTMIPVTGLVIPGDATGGTGSTPALTPQESRRVAAISGLSDSQLAASSDVAATAANKASAPQALVRAHTPQSGFDWGDAGLGAAGGLVLATLGLGGGLAISRRRPLRSRRSTALPG